MRAYFKNGHFTNDHPVYRLMYDNPPEGWMITECPDGADLVIVPTFPHFDGSVPWVVCIEDWVTLYHPSLLNGSTAGVNVLHHPKTKELRKQFSNPNFRGIICHHRGTFCDLMMLGLTSKLYYVPLGLKHQERNRVGEKDDLTFTFINSWRAGDGNFINRGGMIVLECFRRCIEQELTGWKLNILSDIPRTIDTTWITGRQNVEWIRHHVPHDQFDGFIRNTDCILLPSHRVHVHSILYPFSFGIPVVSSDGWGIGDYVINGWNGYRLEGVNGITTWHNLVMREDYSKWEQTMPMANRLKGVVKLMITNRHIFRRFSTNAHTFVREMHSIPQMQRLMSLALSQALETNT